MSRLDAFFRRYEHSANTFDPESSAALYTDVFMGAGPTGVACAANDQAFRDVIRQRAAFFDECGFREARIAGIEETPLDAHYVLARVHWRMRFEKIAGQPRDFAFPTTYIVHLPADGEPKVAFWISHEDERQALRDAGLLPADA